MASQSFKNRRHACWVVGIAMLSSLGSACGNASAPATTEAVATAASAPAASPTAVAAVRLAHPVRVTVDGTHLHSTASVTAPPVGLVFGNDSVDYLGRYNDQWAKVRLRDGTTGFLATEYLEGFAPKPLEKTVAQPAAPVNRPAPTPEVVAPKIAALKAAAPKIVTPKTVVPKAVAPKTVALKTVESKAVASKAAASEAVAKTVAPAERQVPEQGDLAYYCASGNVVKYHSSPDCRGLKKCQATVENMPISEAEASMSPCKICH